MKQKLPKRSFFFALTLSDFFGLFGNFWAFLGIIGNFWAFLGQCRFVPT